MVSRSPWGFIMPRGMARTSYIIFYHLISSYIILYHLISSYIILYHLISRHQLETSKIIQIFSWSPSMLHRPIRLVPKSSFFTKKKTAGSFPKFDIHGIRCRCPEILTLPICSMQLSINLRLAAPSGSLKLKGLNLTSKWSSGKVKKNTKEGGIYTLRIHVWNIYLHWDYFKLL